MRKVYPPFKSKNPNGKLKAKPTIPGSNSGGGPDLEPEVYMRFQKKMNGDVKAVRFMVVLPSNYIGIDDIEMFGYPVYDNNKSVTFLHLRVLPSETETDVKPVFTDPDYNLFVLEIDQSDKISDDAGKTYKTLDLLEDYPIVHVDLPMFPQRPNFPDGDQHEQDLNKGGGKKRFKVFKLDHGQGGTSGSHDP